MKCMKLLTLKSKMTILHPNMPSGKVGEGIESYSSLFNPKASPISNFYCGGYKSLQKYRVNVKTGKMEVNRSVSKLSESNSSALAHILSEKTGTEERQTNEPSIIGITQPASTQNLEQVLLTDLKGSSGEYGIIKIGDAETFPSFLKDGTQNTVQKGNENDSEAPTPLEKSHIDTNPTQRDGQASKNLDE